MNRGIAKLVKASGFDPDIVGSNPTAPANILETKMRLATALLTLAFAATPAWASEAMLKEKGCLACHKTEAKLIGPSYKDVANKYSVGDTNKLATKIKDGGKGVWGAIPMPPNKVTEQEAQELATWILKLK